MSLTVVVVVFVHEKVGEKFRVGLTTVDVPTAHKMAKMSTWIHLTYEISRRSIHKNILCLLDTETNVHDAEYYP